MRTYGITTSDILASIRENRRAVNYWSNGENPVLANIKPGKRVEIVKTHADNMRDLRIMLAAVRFDNGEMFALLSNDFMPVILTDNRESDTDTNNNNDNNDNNDNNNDMSGVDDTEEMEDAIRISDTVPA